ncbi:hypothetical protein ColLi_13238 [Colletotrichum liriopes]|uniref:Uncharacterized protein n=1 Tax=Colletotrichum liriopes TaxID=708192 RepID=A0AA37LYI6_9PEZI|nr:hypothetical protein ColLi_13238 [Colletotrichum liriopes]
MEEMGILSLRNRSSSPPGFSAYAPPAAAGLTRYLCCSSESVQFSEVYGPVIHGTLTATDLIRRR